MDDPCPMDPRHERRGPLEMQQLRSFAGGGGAKHERNRRAPEDGAVQTLTCDLKRDGDAQHWHPTEPRLLSVREVLRLQGFEDSHRLHALPSAQGSGKAVEEVQIVQSWYKQVGNAVPPLVARL